MRSIDGLDLEQIGRWRDVGSASVDPELGEGRLPPGSPPVYRPKACGQTEGTPAPQGGWITWLPWPNIRRQDLGGSRRAALPAGPAPRGFPPTAPPAGASAAVVPPGWAVAVTPDAELRFNSPAQGRY